MTADRWHKSRPAPGDPACREHGKVPAGVHGLGDRWQVRWRTQDGVQHKRNFTRKPDADSFEAQVRAQLDAGNYIDPAAGKITFRGYAEEIWRPAQTHDLPTRERIERVLRLHAYDVIGDQELRALAARPSISQAWIRGLKLSPSSARQAVKDVSAVFNAAVDDQIIARNPLRASSVRLPAVARAEAVPWTAAQIHVMAAALGRKLGTLVVTGAGTGMRIGELSALADDDVDWLRRLVHVRVQIRSTSGGMMFAEVKNRRPHDVPVPDVVLERLAMHVRTYPPAAVTLPWQAPDGPPVTRSLIFTSAGRPLSRQRFGDAWRKAAKAAKLPRGRANGPHVLRHTAASAWLSEGLSLARVAASLGDAQATVLSTYSHFLPDDDDRARRVMGAFLAVPDSGASALDVPSDGAV